MMKVIGTRLYEQVPIIPQFYEIHTAIELYFLVTDCFYLTKYDFCRWRRFLWSVVIRHYLN